MTEATIRDTRFFGHPLGLGVLAGTELWERFSFYGMQAILMLYMTKYLLRPDVAPQVWGLAWFRGVFGGHGDVALAAQTFGLYSGLLYAAPLAGAWLGDGRLGKTRAVTAGALLMTAGHFAMAAVPLFLFALSLIITGAGLVIGNLQAQVGDLYDLADERRTRAFAIYLIALNVGALFAPLVVGTLGEKVGWHWGFGAAGVGMLVALVTYLSGRRHLAPERCGPRLHRAPLTGGDRRAIAGILLVLLPYILVSAACQQAYGIMFVWADAAVAHRVLGWTVPITWLGVADGLMTIFGCWLAASIWKRTAARGSEPTDIAKLGIGCALQAMAFLYIALWARTPMVPMLALLGFYLIQDIAIGWFEAPTAALVSRNAPRALIATMMAVFKAASAASYFLLGWLARFWESLGPSLYWALNGGLALTGLIAILVFGGRVARLLDGNDTARIVTVPT